MSGMRHSLLDLDHFDGSVTTRAGGIYDVLHAVNKMYDFGNDDGDDDDAGRESVESRRKTRTKTEEFH